MSSVLAETRYRSLQRTLADGAYTTPVMPDCLDGAGLTVADVTSRGHDIDAVVVASASFMVSFAPAAPVAMVDELPRR